MHQISRMRSLLKTGRVQRAGFASFFKPSRNRVCRWAFKNYAPFALRIIPFSFEHCERELEEKKDKELRLACQAGRCFGKASESSLASDFSKHLLHSRSEINFASRWLYFVSFTPLRSGWLPAYTFNFPLGYALARGCCVI